MRKLRHFILIIYKHDLNWLFELSGMPGQGFIAGNWDKFGLGSKGLTVFSSSHGFDTTKFVAQTGYDFSFFSSRFEKFGSRIGTHKNLPGKLLRIWMLSNLDHGLKDSPCSPREPLKSKKNRVYFLQIFYLISVWTCIFFYLCQVFNLSLQLLALLNSKVILISVWASLSDGSQGGSGIVSVKLFHVSLAMVILNEFCSTDIACIFSLLAVCVNWTKYQRWPT